MLRFLFGSVVTCGALFCAPLIGQIVFEIEPSPTPPGAETVFLRGVDVIAADDIWAVGTWREGELQFSLTLHFDGSGWSIIDSPSPPDIVGDIAVGLVDVDAVSCDNVYAVGTWTRQINSAEGFLIRWDGNAWEQILVDDENDIPLAPFLESVEVFDAQNIWLGGSGFSPNEQSATLIHFDGSHFTRFDLPMVIFAPHRIRDISIFSTNEVWAVGAAGGGGVAIGRNIVGRWDGSDFDLVPTPQYGFSENLVAVVAVSSDDVWAAGSFRVNGTGETIPLFIHWDGSSWTRFDSPSFASDLVAIATDDIYGVQEDHIIHWDGVSWSIVADLKLPAFQGMLGAIDNIGANEFITAGSLDFSQETLIARFTADREEVLLGDINLDGQVNLLDVAPFVNLITTGKFQEEADMNEDDVVNLLDVQPFVQTLSGN